MRSGAASLVRMLRSTKPAAHAQVALDVEAHVVKADQVAQAAHIHQIRRHAQPVAVVEVLQRLGPELHEEVGALQPHIARLIEQQVRRAQVHHAGRRRVRAQRQPRQAQALAHGQRHVAVAEHAGIERQVVEAARLDAVHAQAAGAVDQLGAVLARPQAGGQPALALALRQHQPALPQHRLFRRQVALVEGTAERNAQRAAGRLRRTGRRAQRAVQVQAVGRGQHDAAAVRADQRRAASRQVQHGLRAGRVQQRAGTQDDVAVDGTGGRIDIGLPVQRAADLDGAAGLHRAIAPAPGVGRHMAAAGGVQHRLLADPDRTGIGLGHIGLLALTRLLDGNAAAPGIEPAQHGDLVGAPDLDRAAGIDADARALAHHDGAALRGPVRVQRQVGAGALRQRAAQRVLGIQRRRPARQDVGGRAPEPGLRGAASSRSTGMSTSICAPSATVRPCSR